MVYQSFVRTSWLWKDYDSVLCSESFARHGGCRSQLLVSHHSRTSAQDLRPLLRVQEDPQRCCSVPSTGQLLGLYLLFTLQRRKPIGNYSIMIMVGESSVSLCLVQTQFLHIVVFLTYF